MPEPHGEKLVYAGSGDGYQLEGAVFTPDSDGRDREGVADRLGDRIEALER